jgi:2-polyprenyl-3-methyl-5-hydroxy-6-metoxy-1,4-benzoquinol methylase
MNFFDRATVGLDLEPTVAFLKQKWPGRSWYTPNEFETMPHLSFPVAGMVICSDVVEHVTDPDDLMLFIQRTQAETIILSTPERDELCLGTHNGPPRNPHHVREWNYNQFHAYVLSWFDIKEHFVLNGTQCVQCSIRPLGAI